MSQNSPTEALDALVGWDVGLDEESIRWRAAAREVADRLRPSIPDWYDSGQPPVRSIARDLGTAGLLGVCLPEPFGRGASAQAYGVICAELEGLDSGIRTLASVQGSLAMEAIHRHGDEETREKWLPGLGRGELIGGFALTEPDVGSDPSSLTTTADRRNGGFLINGVKRWVSNGPDSDVIVVWARTPEGVCAFAVPSDTAGVQITTLPGKASLRTSPTAEVTLDNVDVPNSAHLSGAKGIRAALDCLNEARFGIIFGSAGTIRDSLIAALTYASQREQFGRPLAGFQMTQGKFAAAASELARSWHLALHLARQKDAGLLTAPQVSLGKYANVQSALEITRELRSVLGANGTLLEHSPIRHAANLESVFTYEGTHEMHALILGQALTGESAFR